MSLFKGLLGHGLPGRHPWASHQQLHDVSRPSAASSRGRLIAWCTATSSIPSGAEASTLYELLGVPPEATLGQLKTAFRRLAQRHHPDVSKSSQSGRRYQALAQAYEVLRDEQLRLRYDLYGLAGISSHYQVLKEFVSESCRSTARPASEPGSDAHVVVGLDFTESVIGVETVIQVQVQGRCPVCKGTGGVSETGGQASSCHVCHGSREVLRSVWQPHGGKTMHVGTCPACGGTGTQAQVTCHSCDGDGRVAVQRRVHVKIPGGVDVSSVMRLPGHGHAGRLGGPAGDLMIRFKVHDEPDIQRQGRHLYSDLTCDVWQAMLGCSLPVKSVRGERLLSVPAGSQHGDVIQMDAAGVAEAGPQGVVEYGHHYFTLQVRLPHGDHMDAHERALLEQLRHLGQRSSQEADQQGRSWQETWDESVNRSSQ